METATTDKVIEIQKNAVETIRVHPGECEGVDLIHARIWYGDPTGEVRPTKKGLSLRPELWPEVIAAIRKFLPAEQAGGKAPDEE